MAKMIAGEAVFGFEATQPELYPLLGLELLGFGLYKGIKHHKEKKQKQRDEEQKQRQIEEDRIFEENKRREEEQYQIEQQRIQREAEEQKQRENERQAEQQRIDQLRQQQAEENKQAVQNALERNDEIENQLMQDRRDRLRARDVYVSGYFDDQSWASRIGMSMGAGPERGRDEQWRYISGNYIPGIPDNDPNPNPNPGPNNDPDPNPGPNQNQDEDRPYQNRNMRNPYEHIIQDLTRQIAQNAINKKQSDQQKQEQKQDEQKQEEQKPPGWNPASWQPQIQNSESVSDQALVENELLALIESQGQSQLNQEANLNLQFQQTKQLQRIDQDLTSIIERQVQIDPTQLFSSTLATF